MNFLIRHMLSKRLGKEFKKLGTNFIIIIFLLFFENKYRLTKQNRLLKIIFFAF